MGHNRWVAGTTYFGDLKGDQQEFFEPEAVAGSVEVERGSEDTINFQRIYGKPGIFLKLKKEQNERSH